jgi:hypothetical protein
MAKRGLCQYLTRAFPVLEQWNLNVLAFRALNSYGAPPQGRLAPRPAPKCLIRLKAYRAEAAEAGPDPPRRFPPFKFQGHALPRERQKLRYSVRLGASQGQIWLFSTPSRAGQVIPKSAPAPKGVPMENSLLSESEKPQQFRVCSLTRASAERAALKRGRRANQHQIDGQRRSHPAQTHEHDLPSRRQP